MAILLKADGTVEPIALRLTLEAMQALVGGYIEMLSLGGTPDRRELLIVDEEGLLKEKPLNAPATTLYRARQPYALPGSVIVGDAIRCVVVNEGLETEAYE